eukprot:CAMPEP_0197908876 /NCGR_PEP_ID=MMETSP1439-20131203/67689_1 /TAXON_ID=66791 /ORGANISM="Gonyaulax spinifera, Strain CCMP409" /LENGTH=429 /DNA_ID=CAMNT_0043530407 /DNA_START=118 /DNA_END=1407 /DNA_ORIENTATION=+
MGNPKGRVPKRTLALSLASAAAAATCWQLPSSAFAPSRAVTGLAAREGRPGARGGHRAAQQDAEARGRAAALASLCGLGAVGLACARRGRCRGGAAVARRAEAEAVEKTAKSADVPEDLDWSNVSNEWEVDCFSRPVTQDGKKMWELMVTDANAVYRRVAQMKPTRVNSVVVQKLITIFINESKVKPKVIRFYRKVMKNMLTVALNTIKDSNIKLKDVKILPSRNCHTMRQWLSWREREVYPKMQGYVRTPVRRSSSIQASMVQMTFEGLPERLRFSRYAISAIPLGALARVKPGQLPGNICRVAPGYGDNTMVYGIVILSTRAQVICSILKTMELSAVRLNSETNELLMDLGIDTTYRIEKVPIEDREGALQFERTKRQLGGLHFVAVHNPILGGEPNLPIEADDMGPGEGCITGLWLCTDYAPTDTQ